MPKANAFQFDLVGTAECLWRYTVTATGESVSVSPPQFEIEGRAVNAAVSRWHESAPTALPQGGDEHRAVGQLADAPYLTLELVWRIAHDNPVVRFRYLLHSPSPVRLTKSAGRDNLTYLTASLAPWPQITEVRVAEFNERVHSFCLTEYALTPRHFENAFSAMGPILAAGSADHAWLLAYEHGSQVPDAFLEYRLAPDRTLSLQAVKGNYYDGQGIDANQPYATPWLQVAMIAGDPEALAAAYRDFVLRCQSPNLESRQPYIFYNTWAYQERSKWWRHKTFLDPMTQDRMLAEIDAAHKMGVDVFVLDTGWYEKTGDWQVNPARFPDGLKAVKAKLDTYGMKLGLWFDPLAAAVSSRMAQEHLDCRITRGGRVPDPHSIWETEESYRLCLVSRYADSFADELIRLVREVGVTYFKWDAISQYDCDDPHHAHGTPDNTDRERADSYAFQQVQAMAHIVDRLCQACPEAIVDFDITEGGRSVGLAFLSAGKYFLINNGPYYGNYDLPIGGDAWSNLFVHPGPARPWICRTPLTYDKWLPSVLFLTHYLPDDSTESQWINLASLVLGQNGIWGDLLAVSEDGLARFGEVLAKYKIVRDDITRAPLRRTGDVGGSLEIYEKIDPQTGRGVVSVFASAAGRSTYVTESSVTPPWWHNDGVSVRQDAQGRAVLKIVSEAAGAKLILFGVVENQ